MSVPKDHAMSTRLLLRTFYIHTSVNEANRMYSHSLIVSTNTVIRTSSKELPSFLFCIPLLFFTIEKNRKQKFEGSRGMKKKKKKRRFLCPVVCGFERELAGNKKEKIVVVLFENYLSNSLIHYSTIRPNVMRITHHCRLTGSLAKLKFKRFYRNSGRKNRYFSHSINCHSYYINCF